MVVYEGLAVDAKPRGIREIVDGLQPDAEFAEDLVLHLRKVGGSQVPLLFAQRDFWSGREIQSWEDVVVAKKILAPVVAARNPVRAAGIFGRVTRGV